MSDSTSPRTCHRCSASSDQVEFSAVESICLDCRRARGRSHYALNRSYYLDKARERNRQTSEATKEWVVGYLSAHPCVDCGANDIRVLEFDHVDRTTKSANVSFLITAGYSLETVKREIRKCQVRCANCHLIRTRTQRGWWRANLGDSAAE